MGAVSRPNGKASFLLWASIIASLLLTSVVFFFTYDDEYRWLGHAIVSITGLILIILVVINGATLTGRLKRGTTNAYSLHKNASVFFSLFMAGTFFFGLWITYLHGEELLTSVHGWLGLAIGVLAILQVVPCLSFKRRVKVRFPHMAIGYILVVLIVLQTAWGLEIALVGEVKDLVLIHSTFGAIAALALTWIIVELRHLTPKGLVRAKFASYIAAFFNIVGCWIVSGIYYVTVYGSQIRPIILSGPNPWIHRIVMETKEHVFLFLPVLSITIMLMFVWLGKDETLLENSKIRKAIISLAVLALAMIIINFVFGVLVSYAANPIVGGE